MSFPSTPFSDFFDFYYDNYGNPLVRSQPYYLAMTVGVILHITKNKKIKMSKVKINLACI